MVNTSPPGIVAFTQRREPNVFIDANQSGYWPGSPEMAVTENRAEEQALKQTLLEQQDIQSVAIDFGGEFVPSVKKSSTGGSAAQRQGLVPSNHVGRRGCGRCCQGSAGTDIGPGGGTFGGGQDWRRPSRGTSVRGYLSGHWRTKFK